MTSEERVLTALACEIPDVVPYMYSFIDVGLQEEIVGHELRDYLFDLNFDPGLIAKPGDEIEYRLNYCVHPETARKLKLDAIAIRFPTPLFCLTRLGRGGHGVERGLLSSWDALKAVKERIEQLAPGGGYIISDSNSVPYFCKAENVIAMSDAVRKYRDFYAG